MTMVNVSEKILVEVGGNIRQFIGKQINTQVQIKAQLQVAAQVFSPLLRSVDTNIILVRLNIKI
jgi:hypothetical protein